MVIGCSLYVFINAVESRKTSEELRLKGFKIFHGYMNALECYSKQVYFNLKQK